MLYKKIVRATRSTRFIRSVHSGRMGYLSVTWIPFLDIILTSFHMSGVRQAHSCVFVFYSQLIAICDSINIPP